MAPLVADLQARVRARIRERLLECGGAPEFDDRELFDAVETTFRRALEARDRGVLLVPEMLRDEEEWRVDAPLRFSTHRPVLGRAILFLKKRLLFPLNRWLYEYSRDRLARQHQVNVTLFACLEALAIENARLRQELERRAPRPVAPGARDPDAR